MFDYKIAPKEGFIAVDTEHFMVPLPLETYTELFRQLHARLDWIQLQGFMSTEVVLKRGAIVAITTCGEDAMEHLCEPEEKRSW